MRLYLAGIDTTGAIAMQAFDKDNGFNFLFSYYYLVSKKCMYKVDWAIQNKGGVFLDSGAFSAMHSGAYIDIDAYCDFIKEHGAKFEKIAALDCIGDWKGTEKNLQYMRKKGVNPIPVFHTNEPFDYLDNLLKENDYLCLGVTGSKLRQPQIIAWLVEVFKHRRDINPDCKIHGFALTSAKIMRFFDWDTCDSTSWLSGGRFSFIYQIEGTELRSYSRDKWHKIKGKITDERLFITPNGESERVIPLWKHNAETILQYVEMINTLKGKAVVSPKPTV